MTIYFTGSMVLGVLTAFVWLVRLLAIGPALRRRTALTASSYHDRAAPQGKVSVLIAAKDEEHTIETCVRSLFEQDYPNFEVIVADDRSADRTPEILSRLQEEFGDRLRCRRIDDLPEGWTFGKSHAMHRAVSFATGDWLLFTDADCRQISPRTITTAIHDAVVHHADFLSVTPVLESETFWERVFQPACTLTLIVWFLPDRVNDPRKATAYANGAFMLLRRSCYEGVGGHLAVRAALNEDIHLARAAKRAGFQLRVCGNEGLYSTRMYRSIGEAWRGWTRNFYGCLETLPRLAAAAALVFVVSLVPWISALASWLALSLDSNVHDAWRVASSLIWTTSVILMQLVLWRMYPVVAGHSRFSLLYFFGAAGTFAVLCNAIIKAAGISGITWRGHSNRKMGSVVSEQADRSCAGPTTSLRNDAAFETQVPRLKDSRACVRPSTSVNR